jgi:hypothetical protein
MSSCETASDILSFRQQFIDHLRIEVRRSAARAVAVKRSKMFRGLFGIGNCDKKMLQFMPFVL